MSTSKFVTAVLKNLNKDEKQLQKEKVEQFVQDAKIEAEIQLSQYETGDLQKAKLQLTRDENQVIKAKKAFEDTRFSLHKDFATYFAVREKARSEIFNAEQKVQSTKSEIEMINNSIQQFKDIIADFA